MTKTKLGLFAIPFIATIMISAGISAQWAAADPDGSNPQSAMIIRDFGCLLFNGNDVLVFADSSKTVITDSGKRNLKCQGDVLAPSDGKAHVLKGFPCNANGVLTTDTHSTVSAAGKSTLICKV